MTRLARFLCCTRGAAAAEMALILPIAVLLMFGGLETGHYFYQEHQVIKGLRDAGRYAARQPFEQINCRGGNAFISTDVRDKVRTLALTGKLSNGTLRIAGWEPSDIRVEVLCPGDDGYPNIDEAREGIFNTDEPAPRVVVSTTFNYDSLFNGLGVINDSASLNASHQATVMGI